MVIVKRKFMIGGEFENKFTKSNHFFADKLLIKGTYFNSGRAAFDQILTKLINNKVNKIYAPAYTCPSLVERIIHKKLKYSFYDLDNNLIPKIKPCYNSAILIIHYFGWENKLKKNFHKLKKKKIFLVEDLSHSFLNSKIKIREKNLIFLSLRKFGIYNDGGWCNLNLNRKFNNNNLANLYLSFRNNKINYVNQKNKYRNKDIESEHLAKLSNLEKKINLKKNFLVINQTSLNQITNLDLKSIKKKRRNNFNILNKYLKKYSLFKEKLYSNIVPLGYPILISNRDEIRKLLKMNGIFCPVHWKMHNFLNKKKFPSSVRLSKNILTLPIDQRYGKKAMLRIVNILKENIKYVT
jgi:dTDP-4-amino-4,6-dideoxygalactose transaminase|tara:strand:- start:7691 stop:8746 length:1056 start_codon:yes stop_codon:yes gene_type:complete